MARLSPKHLLVMLLAVFLTAGFSLSAVQATTMPIRMATAMVTHPDPGMGKMAETPMKGDCNACPKESGKQGSPMQCPAVCLAPVLAVLPQDFGVTPVASAQQPSALPAPFLHGRSSVPDPYPPRSKA